jgi:hypothetical protein
MPDVGSSPVTAGVSSDDSSRAPGPSLWRRAVLWTPFRYLAGVLLLSALGGVAWKLLQQKAWRHADGQVALLKSSAARAAQGAPLPESILIAARLGLARAPLDLEERVRRLARLPEYSGLGSSLLRPWSTARFEAQLTQQDLMIFFLRSASLGGNRPGSEAVAQQYFKKPISEIGPEEAALLAAMALTPPKDGRARAREVAELGRSILRDSAYARFHPSLIVYESLLSLIFPATFPPPPKEREQREKRVGPAGPATSAATSQKHFVLVGTSTDSQGEAREIANRYRIPEGCSAAGCKICIKRVRGGAMYPVLVVSAGAPFSQAEAKEVARCLRRASRKRAIVVPAKLYQDAGCL